LLIHRLVRRSPAEFGTAGHHEAYRPGCPDKPDNRAERLGNLLDREVSWLAVSGLGLFTGL
jgi:hypothetical protein